MHWNHSQKDCVSDLINNWHSYQQKEPSKQSLMLASTWEQVNQLSNHARKLLQAEGKVGAENIDLECWVADRKMTFEFSVGDRIKLTKNDYRKGLFNGTLGTITDIQKFKDKTYQIGLVADNGKNLTFKTDEYCNEEGLSYFALGYAMTIYSSQGSTVNGNTFILHSSQMDRASCYVAGSRHKDESHWFIDNAAIDAYQKQGKETDRLKTLAELMNRDKQPQLALDYLLDKNKEVDMEI